MKLIYVYFDFTNGGENPEGYRGFTKCGFNFGTDYYFWMEEQADKSYILKGIPRPEGEKIEPCFWRDKRLYNVSALVGDNGTGKSTIIHEIIHSLLENFNESDSGQSASVILWQDCDGNYYWRSRQIQVKYVLGINADVLNNDTYKPLIDKTKLVYFSNALSLSDVRLFESITKEYSGLLYGYPFYDCSLITDLNWAMKVSGVLESSVDRHLDTYFNFRSYQEARYVFDRGQRELLTEMKDKYNFPVPVPTLLTLKILPAYPIMRDSLKNNISESLLSVYLDYLLVCTESEALISELCMNCLAYYLRFVSGEYLNCEEIQAIINSGDFGNRAIYISLLDSFYFSSTLRRKNDNRFCNDDKDWNAVSVYYNNCCNYINFLWNNRKIIETPAFFEIKKMQLDNGAYSVQCQIFLGKKIDEKLEEFMIRFINLTRAVSLTSYFVIYNWGLSSGESNLLHMFTKLRYLIKGVVFDIDTSAEEITEYKTMTDTSALSAKREETLMNYYGSQKEICDSVILFIDEADLTLHPDWQRQLIAILTFFLPRLYKDPYYIGDEHGCRSIQIIIGTHSPIMLGDFPAPCVIYLQRKEDGTIEVNDKNKLQPFGQNIYTILKDGFYLKKGTLGELARRKIEDVLKDIRKIRECGDEFKKLNIGEWEERLSDHRKMTVQYLPKGIIRSKLEDELSICERFLNKENQRANEATAETNESNPQIREIEEEIARLNKRLEELKKGGVE